MIIRKRISVCLVPALFLCLFFVSGCSNREDNTAGQPTTTTDSTSTVAADTAAQQEPALVITYRRVPVAGRKGLDSLSELVGEEYLTTILRLNRKDRGHVSRNDTLIVPDTLTDLMAYSPFPPHLPSAGQIRKLIFVDQHIQAIAAYENGTLVFWGPASTGKKSTPTDTGLFHTNWRSRKRNSTIDNEWVMEWYWNLANRSGVSMHQYDLPGYPASHACVRLLKEDAQWFYEWCEAWRLDNGAIAAEGTPVIIYNTYQFSETAPWKLLPESPDATRVGTDALSAVLAPHLPTIVQEQHTRDSVLAARAQPPSQQGSDTSRGTPLP